MEQISEQLNGYFEQYGKALENYDVKTVLGFYGFPCFMISDDIVRSLTSAEELNNFLTQAQEIYKQFDLTRVTHQFTKIEVVSEKLVRVRITWNYYDSKDNLLVSSDYVHLLRKENDSYKIYVVIPFNEQQVVQELLQKKNVSN